MNETELLHAFRKERSEEAFAELVRRYAGMVYSVAKRRMANTALAEDITQIVFIRFAKTPPNLKNQAELSAWLHRTTINVTIDTWRAESRRRAREQEATNMEPASPEDTIWEDISPNLDEALNQLNDMDRQALLLRFFGRKKMTDVGVALGVSEDAAKMRVGRAVDRLRTQLGVGRAAFTAALLGTLLADHSVKAAPSQLISRLAAMRLPAVAGVAGMGGFFHALLRCSRLKLAAGTVVLALIGINAVQLLRPWSAPVPEAMSESPTVASGKTVGEVRRARIDSNRFNASLAPPTKAVKIMFHVLDAETAGGLANTKIHFAYFGAGGVGESHDMLSDNNGDAAIPDPDDPTKNTGPNVFVTADGYVPKVVGFQSGAVPADYTMRLDPAMTAGGIVVDEQGSPVSGVEIRIQTPGNKTGQIENVDFQTCRVTNRDDGSWSYSYIPKDYTNEIRFILTKPDHAVTFPVVTVDQVDLTNLVLVINRGFTVTGRIADPRDRPIANARIATLDGNSSKRQSTQTDVNGVFTLAGVGGNAEIDAFYHESALETNGSGGVIIRGLAAQGRMHVEVAVQAKEFSALASIVELSDATNIVNLTLSTGSVFRGRVVDEAGNAIPSAVVRTDYDFKKQIEKRFEWTTSTDEDGRFEWDSAPTEEICYWFEADGYQVIRGMPLLAGGIDHEITLKSKAGK